jgi:hypothetical protein
MKTANSLMPFFFFLLMLITQELFPQNYSTRYMYQEQGESIIERQVRTEYNPYSGQFYNVTYCRQLNWFTRFYSGQVYYQEYNPYTRQFGWASHWQEGNFWYCTWSGWYVCY